MSTGCGSCLLTCIITSCHSSYLCPFFQPYSHFPRPLSCHSPSFHQMPSDISSGFPDPATPLCPAITSFPSHELLHPSPYLYLFPSSATLHIINRSTSFVPWSVSLCCLVAVLSNVLVLELCHLNPNFYLDPNLPTCLPVLGLPVCLPACQPVPACKLFNKPLKSSCHVHCQHLGPSSVSTLWMDEFFFCQLGKKEQ